MIRNSTVPEDEPYHSGGLIIDLPVKDASSGEEYWGAYIKKLHILNQDCLAKKFFVKEYKDWNHFNTLMLEILAPQVLIRVRGTYTVEEFRKKAEAYIVELRWPLSEPNAVQKAIKQAILRLADETSLHW